MSQVLERSPKRKRPNRAAKKSSIKSEPLGNREEMWKHGLSWPVAGWLLTLHVGAIFALFFFSWTGLFLALGLHWLTGGVGICLGFHRLLTHRSFKTQKPVFYGLAWLGGLAGEGSSLAWVANHRKHHAFSDDVGDPHSPHDGPWWSHVTWTLADMPKSVEASHFVRWIPDLKEDKVLKFLDSTFLLWHLLLGFGLMGIGYAIGGAYMAASLVTWGMFVRLVSVLHSTWFVNSASHMWGYRNYETTDDSRNNWWVALITYGEGWHNNHHAYPTMARHGHRWWEVDATFLTIRLMEKIGIAWDVVDNRHKRGIVPDAEG